MQDYLQHIKAIIFTCYTHNAQIFLFPPYLRCGPVVALWYFAVLHIMLQAHVRLWLMYVTETIPGKTLVAPLSF